MGSEGKGKAVPHRDGALDRRRRTAGIVSALVGAPNLIASAIILLAGIVGAIVLVVILIGLIFTDTGGDPWGAFFVILFIILGIIALAGLLILLVIFASLLAFFAGQVIGGILAYKGKRFGLSVTLLVTGTILSLLFGGITALVGIGADTEISIKVLLILWGLYSIGSSVTTGICTYHVIRSRGSFQSKPRKKGRK